MDSLSYWLLFFSTAFILNITPGPDLIYILSRTIAQGKKIGIASSIGVCTGALFHVFAAALGLSAILATSALAFTIVKIIGAFYLFYLGFKSIFSAGTSIDFSNEDKPNVSTWQAFKQGVLIDILNPKVAIFFMAFLPQFIRTGEGHASVQIIILGFLVILVASFVEIVFVLIAGRTTDFFRTNKRMSVYLDRALGSVFIGLGIRLALTRHQS